MKNTLLKKKTASKVIYNIIMIALCIIIIFPFLWTFASSFKTIAQIYQEKPTNLVPKPITTENYKRIVEILPFGRFVLNGFFLSVTIPLCMIFIGSMAAFSLARLRFKGRDAIFILLISTMMIPTYVTLIPNFAIISRLGLRDNYLALFLHGMFTGMNATVIFFFRQYFLSIPRDLENAAIIDGCSWTGVFFKIVLPNSKPVIATMIILTFRSIWNSFLWPVIVLDTYEKMTITVGLKYLSEFTSNWGELMAGSTISILPMVIVYLVFQKYFVSSNINSGFGGN
ncbi:MAG: carbohydrate ABC transporter permease [Sphaerochaetaceae bacterium]